MRRDVTTSNRVRLPQAVQRYRYGHGRSLPTSARGRRRAPAGANACSPRTDVRYRAAAMERSVDDLATPLHEVTFCVVDLETTGASAATCAITEVGAARFRGGECLGTFQTLVDAGGARRRRRSPCSPASPTRCCAAQPARRGGAAGPRRVRRRRRARRAQRALRRRPSSTPPSTADDRAAVGARTVDTARPRPPAGGRRRRRPAGSAPWPTRSALPHRPSPPGARRRAGHGRPAPRAARAGRPGSASPCSTTC